MGYITPEVYQQICNIAGTTLPDIFVETGTFKGGIPHRWLSTYNSISPFKKAYTFELSDELCKVASERYRLYELFAGDQTKFNFHTDDLDHTFSKSKSFLNNTITLINSDSVVGLRKLLKTIDVPCCFWLDAHAGAMKYARGNVDVPILQELDEIKNHHVQGHIIAIDDTHLFGSTQYDKTTNEKSCDYSMITKQEVVSRIRTINPNYTVKVVCPLGHEMIIAYLTP